MITIGLMLVGFMASTARNEGVSEARDEAMADRQRGIVENITAQLGHIDKRLDSIDTRLKNVSTRTDDHAVRIARLEEWRKYQETSR